GVGAGPAALAGGESLGVRACAWGPMAAGAITAANARSRVGIGYFCWNPAGIEISALVTSVVTLSASVVPVMTVARGFATASPSILFLATFLAKPPMSPPTPPDALTFPSSSLA